LVRKLLLLFTVPITAENMDTSGIDYTNTTLVSFMYTATKLRTKTAESPKEYQITTHCFQSFEEFSK
jgi:hypothetical protein